MSKLNDILKPRPVEGDSQLHSPVSKPKDGERGILFRFTLLGSWVIVIGAVLSLVACKQNAPKIFTTPELVESKAAYRSGVEGIPILIPTLRRINLYISGINCEQGGMNDYLTCKK